MKNFMKGVDAVSWLLLVIGGINWGLIGFFDYNLVAAIFGGEMLGITRIIYAAVGVSALYEIFTLKLIRDRWTPICRQEHVGRERLAT